MKKLLLIGGGGHCRSVLDSVLSSGTFDKVGIVDPDPSANCSEIETVGRDEDLPWLFQEGWHYAFVSVGSIGNTYLRRKLFTFAKQIGFTIPAILDSSAILARDVALEEGVFVGKGAVINSGTHVGICAIINSGAILEHDCRIGNFAHISPGALLCGHVTVGDNTHIGAGTVVRQQLSVGPNTLIGIGSVIVNNIPASVKAYGNPCLVVDSH